MKSWKRNIVYAVIIFTILISLSLFSNKIMSYQNSTLRINMYIFWLIMFFINLVFGLTLGIESLHKEIKKDGKWYFDIPRIILLGIPSLIMGFYYFIYYLNVHIILTLTQYLPKFMIQSSLFIMLNQILFGYILITNFTKQKDLKSETA